MVDVLQALYAEHGFYRDAQDNFVFRGIDGIAKISSLVDGLRKMPPFKCGMLNVVKMEDYTSQEMIDAGFARSNVRRFLLSDGSWVAVRPSGTEPKCKFYFCVRASDEAQADEKLAVMRATFETNS